MKRIAVVIILLFAMSLRAEESQIEPIEKKVEWTRHHSGIFVSKNSATMPRLQRIYVIRIDLNEKGLSFFTTPRCSDRFEEGKRETLRQRTNEFLEQHKLLVAVNANFFSIPKGEAYAKPGSSDLRGVAVSDGIVVSNRDTSDYRAIFAIKKDGTPIIAANLKSDDELHEWTTAVAGNVLILNAGEIVRHSDKAVHPRTAVGISEDKRFVYLLVIDGRQEGYSIGATYAETAAWLRFYGAWDGLNLDGGGSTTMVLRNEQGQPYIINRPSDRRPRYNGNNLGVRTL